MNVDSTLRDGLDLLYQFVTLSEVGITSSQRSLTSKSTLQRQEEAKTFREIVLAFVSKFLGYYLDYLKLFRRILVKEKGT